MENVGYISKEETQKSKVQCRRGCYDSAFSYEMKEEIEKRRLERIDGRIVLYLAEH